MKTIILISGRYIQHNPYREIVIYDKLKENGYVVSLFLPSSDFKRGYPEKIINDSTFKKYSPSIFKSTLSLILKTINHQYFILGSDYYYNGIGLILRLLNKKVLSYDSAGGMDHKQNFANITCIKSSYYSRYIKTIEYGWAKYLYKSKLFQRLFHLRPEKSHKITGSILYEKKQNYILSFEELKQKYSVENIIVFFPKSIITYKNKMLIWFKGKKDNKSINDISIKHNNLCSETVNKLLQCGFNPVIKLHPSIFNSSKEKYEEELFYWKSLGAKIMEPDDSYSFYKNMELGISINSHSVMDVNYFRKPFLFIKDGQCLPSLDAPSWKFHKYTSLPLGPNNEWKKKLTNPENKFFPSWVGYFSDISSLNTEKISSYIKNPIDKIYYDRFIKEFWLNDDGLSADRIVKEFSNLIKK